MLVVLLGCGGGGGQASTVDAPKAIDAPAGGSCASEAEIMFAQATGCENDGSVEFCIPANNSTVMAQLTAIDPSITCAAGGGRAGCLAQPDLLLCFYPTTVPEECVAQHGAMTNDAWANVCAIAALPEVTKIVHTIFE